MAGRTGILLSFPAPGGNARSSQGASHPAAEFARTPPRSSDIKKRVFLLTAALALQPAFAQNDSTLERAVRRALNAGTFRQVRATVERGIVTLTGSVGRYQIKSKAEDQVSRVQGVGRIRDEIQVVTPAIPDKKLERNVEAAMAYSVFRQYGALPDLRRILLVQARNGILTIAGVVPSQLLATQLFAAAARTQGVIGIVDRLQVGPVSALQGNWPSSPPAMGTGISN